VDVEALARGTAGRGLHSSTFRLNLSALCGIGGTLVHLSAQRKRFVWDGGYTRPPFGST